MKKIEWIPYLVGACLLCVSLGVDYPLTNALYQSVPLLGIIFERFVLIPIQGILVLTFCMLYVEDKKIYYLMIAYGMAYYLIANALYYWITIHGWIYIVILIFAGILVYGMKQYIVSAHGKWILQQKSWFVFFTCVLVSTMLITTCMKAMWGRVRYRDLLDLSQFSQWYQIQGFNHNYSFPSGHMAAMSSILCLLQWKKNKYEQCFILRYIGIGIVIVGMAISRMIMGAHYLSDLTMGFVIGYSCYLFWKKRVM